MLFDPLTWAAGFALTRATSTVLDWIKPPAVQSALQRIAQKWADNLPEELRFRPDVIFTARDAADLSEAPRRHALSAELSAGRIPSPDLWHQALIEGWRTTRDELIKETGSTFTREAIPFLQLEEDEAGDHLKVLAKALADTLSKDPDFSRREVLGLVRELKDQQEGLASEVRRYLPEPPPEIWSRKPIEAPGTESSPSMELDFHSERNLTWRPEICAMPVEQRYLSFFRTMSLHDLVRGSREIEERISLDVRAVIEQSLENCGYIMTPISYFQRERDRIRLHTIRIPQDGGCELKVTFERLTGRKHSRRVKSTLVREIGAVQEFTLEIPEPSPFNTDNLQQELLTLFRSAYLALERTLLRKNSQAGQQIFSDLHDVISLRLAASGNSDLLGRFWLILATDGLVLYFFDGDSLRRTIDHYKRTEENGVHGKSPFELVTAIMTETFPFKKSLAIEAWRQKRPLSLAWADARYVEDAPVIHLAEVKLYASDDYTGFVPCSAGDYYFIVGCRTEVKDRLIPEVQAVTDKLCSLFAQAVPQWSAYLTMLSGDIWETRAAVPTGNGVR